MKYRFIFVLIVLLFSSLQCTWENYEPPLKPYWPEYYTITCNSFNEYFLYNYAVNNYDEAIKLFEEQIFNLEDSIRFRDYEYLYPYYIDASIRIRDFQKALYACNEWKYLNENFAIDYTIEQKPYIYSLVYCLFLSNQNNLALKLFEENELEPKEFFSKFRFIRMYEPLIIKWYVSILADYIDQKNLAIEIIDHYDFFILKLTKARILAEKDISQAISYLETEQILFTEDQISDIHTYSIKYEESNMLLSYLYFKIGATDKAQEIFKKALTEYSTFMGDWEIWLENRSFQFEDEMEVIMELKNQYLQSMQDDEE